MGVILSGGTVDLDVLHKLAQEHYLTARPHIQGGLWIFNYTPKTVYTNTWTPETRMARGLIVDDAGVIRARPFEKFFNLGDPNHGAIPDEPFEVYEKFDGSLGILYWHNDEPAIATRGSFNSEQAFEATDLLRERLAETGLELDRSKTYLFEIILPWNRIVVDYGDRRDLVLLAVIDTESGRDLPLEDIGFPIVETHTCDELDDLFEREAPNREGYVVRFESGLRVKVKFDAYQQLHRLLCGITPRKLWELLKDGQEPTTLPGWYATQPAFQGWVDEQVAKIKGSYQEIADRAPTLFRRFETRKESAEHFTQFEKPYPPILFRMLDGRPYDDIIWKHIYPAAADAFRRDDE